jgi:plasmid stability protein
MLMAQFVVRNLEEDVHARLRAIAREHGQSMEEFVREVLRGIALAKSPPRVPLGTGIAARFAEIGLTNDEAIGELKGQVAEPPRFE